MGERLFQIEGEASAKVLRLEGTCCVYGPAMRPLWLKQIENRGPIQINFLKTGSEERSKKKKIEESDKR